MVLFIFQFYQVSNLSVLDVALSGVKVLMFGLTCEITSLHQLTAEN